MNVVRRLLSTALAAALVTLGALVAVEVVLAALDRPAWLLPHSTTAATLRDNTWQSPLARLLGIGAVVLGGLLLLLSVRRGKPAALALTPMTDSVDAFVDRRGLQRALRDRARRVDGILQAKVKLGRRRVNVRARSALRDTTGLGQQVEQQLHGALDDLALAKYPSVKVRLRRRT